MTFLAIFPRPTKCIQNSMFVLLKSRWLLAKNGLYRYVNTRIMTAAVDPKHEKLRRHLKVQKPEGNSKNTKCAFQSVFVGLT